MIRKNRFLPGLCLLRALIPMAGPFVGACIPLASAAAGVIINDCSPRIGSFPIPNDNNTSVSGRTLSLTVSADGERLYAGTFSGVWRSDDGGAEWHQLTQPQPPSGINVVPGALRVPNVFDVVVSLANKDVVLAATTDDTRVPSKSKNGIYRSNNGGDSWRLVHQFKCPVSSHSGAVGQIVFAPDNPKLVYAAGGCAIAISKDGGKTWQEGELYSTRV